jgi:uncharacterized protein YndB with AHSA1/START domain
LSADKEEAPAGRTIRVARVIAATPDALFRAVVDCEAKKQWWGKTAKQTLAACAMDARVGGSFRYGMQSDAGTDEASGTILELHAPYRIALAWSCSGKSGTLNDTRVTIEFVNLRDGLSRGVVTHQNLPNRAAAPAQQAAWANMLQDLAIYSLPAE